MHIYLAVNRLYFYKQVKKLMENGAVNSLTISHSPINLNSIYKSRT